MAVAENKEGDLDPGQTNAGAPPAPADDGNKKPEGMDETHDGAGKEAPPEPAKDEPPKDTPPAEKPTDEPPLPKDEGPLKEFVSLDHPAGDAAIGVLKEAGVGPNEAQAYFAEAIASGDLSKINWAAIEAKIGSAKAFLVRTGVESYYKDAQAKVQNTVAETIKIYGTQENWDNVRNWAQTKEKGDTAFKDQLDGIRDLLNAGGVKAQAGARELLRLYNSDPGTKGKDNGRLVVGDSTGTVIGTPLSRADYVEALKVAYHKGQSATEINALHARRKAGKAQGM